MSKSFINIGIGVERYDKEAGLWVVEQDIKEAHSWTKQAAQIWMCGLLSDASPAATVGSVLDIGNTSRTLESIASDTAAKWMRSDGAANDDTLGIIVGIGTTPVNEDDIAIETIIDNGSISGDLDYKAMDYPDGNVPLAVTGGYRLRLQRQFENLSGGTITITEAALYVENDLDGGSTAKFCVLHDLLTVQLLNTEVKRVQYRFDFLV